MKYAIAGLAGAIVLLGFCSPVLAVDGQVSMTIGSREPLDDWLQSSDSNRHQAIGLRADFGPDDASLKASVGLNFTLGDEMIGDGIFSPSPNREDLQRISFLKLTEDQDAELTDLFGDTETLGDALTLSEDELGEFAILDSFEATTMELSVGFLVRPTGEKKFLPFLGGGLSHITVDAEGLVLEQIDPTEIGKFLERRTETDRTTGIYLSAGATWRIKKNFSLGAALRVLSQTSVTFSELGVSGDVDYAELGAILGYDW